MSYTISGLADFCRSALIAEGMKEEYAGMCAYALANADAFGIHSHGTKNLWPYIQKFRLGGMDISGEPRIVTEGPSYAVIDAGNTLGMIAGVTAMECACRKARETGTAIVTVRNSSHPGAECVYGNIAAEKGMIGIAISNTNPNMTAPGAVGKVIGNNPIGVCLPAKSIPSIMLDISTSFVAALRVLHAKAEGIQVPLTWITDENGNPTSDPSRFPENSTLQPMAEHKGYALAVIVEILTGVLSGGGIGPAGEIPSWRAKLAEANNASQTYAAIDISKFMETDLFGDRVETLISSLHSMPAVTGGRVIVPGETEWEKYRQAEEHGLCLPDDTLQSLDAINREVFLK